MTSINLLPRKPFLEQHLVRLIVIIVVVMLISVAGHMYYADKLKDQTHDIQNEMMKLDGQISFQSNKRMLDALTARINRFSTEATKLKADQRVWLPTFAPLLGFLPEQAVLSNMRISVDGQYMADYKFVKYSDMVRYISDLQAIKLYENVKVEKLTLITPAVQEDVIDVQQEVEEDIFNYMIDTEAYILRKELSKVLSSKPILDDSPLLLSESIFLDDSSPFSYSELVDIVEERNNLVPNEQQPISAELTTYFELILHIQVNVNEQRVGAQ